MADRLFLRDEMMRPFDMSKKIMLIGWDAADWKVIHELGAPSSLLDEELPKFQPCVIHVSDSAGPMHHS